MSGMRTATATAGPVLVFDAGVDVDGWVRVFRALRTCFVRVVERDEAWAEGAIEDARERGLTLVTLSTGRVTTIPWEQIEKVVYL